MTSNIAIQINLRFYGLVSVFALLIILFNLEEGRSQKVKTDGFYLGWASADITPTKPVLIAGQFHARMSEGIRSKVVAVAVPPGMSGSTSARSRSRTATPSVGSWRRCQYVPHEMHKYPGTQHGFHNNSTPRYTEAAAKLAWERTIAFFRKNLA